MRKPVAILFLSLHIFSLLACFIVYAVKVYRSDRFFEKQTGLGLYNVNDLTEVRIPANLGISADWKSYENIQGEVRFANTAYNYVKIRVTSNAIYLMCVPNYANTRLCAQNIIDARSMPDIPVNKKDHVPFEKIYHISVFNAHTTWYRFLAPVTHVSQSSSVINTAPVESSLDNPAQPPDVC